MALVTVPRYTVDDPGRFPDDGNRYELLDGVLPATPAPRALHRIVATRIAARLDSAVGSIGHAVGSGAISVPPRTQRQPDILVYPSRFGGDRPGHDPLACARHRDRRRGRAGRRVRRNAR
ncbi:MAG TPA: Uma2 family endonuclease [Gemmatimonadaceae bacterium]|nr:Uma2 family endonuclease [Gemmatimonadaceae bacterium]